MPLAASTGRPTTSRTRDQSACVKFSHDERVIDDGRVKGEFAATPQLEPSVSSISFAQSAWWGSLRSVAATITPCVDEQHAGQSRPNPSANRSSMREVMPAADAPAPRTRACDPRSDRPGRTSMVLSARPVSLAVCRAYEHAYLQSGAAGAAMSEAVRYLRPR